MLTRLEHADRTRTLACNFHIIKELLRHIWWAVRRQSAGTLTGSRENFSEIIVKPTLISVGEKTYRARATHSESG
jgi:hypothetical protein